MRFLSIALVIFSASACAQTADGIVARSNTELPARSHMDPASAEWDTAPERIRGKAPIYPISLMLSGGEGESVVVFTIGVDGRTSDFEVQSTTDERYANHAIIALREWRFKPALKDGVPVEVRVRQSFTYKF